MDSLSSDVRGRGNVCLETVKNSPNDMTPHTMEETRIGHHVNSSEYHNELDDFLVSDKLKIQNEALTFPVEQKMEDTKADTMLSEISMSPITTETDIDITSALLPSGGTQSHHHAMRMAVLETGQVQSSYNFPQQTKDIGIFQCQPFTLPKNQSNRSDKSRSTFPFSMGTQSLPLSRKKKQPEPFLLESQNDKIFMAAMEIKIEKHNWKGGPLVNEADFIQELASEILIKGQNPTYSQNNDYINMQSTDFVGSKLKNTTELNVLHNSTVDMDSLPSDSIAAHNIECQEPKQAISFQVEESPGVTYTDIVTQNLHDIPKHCIIVQHNEYNDPAQNNNLLHHQHKCEKINRSEVVESGNIRDTGLGISSVMLDLHGAGQEQSDSINIVENTCWPEKDLDSEHPTDIDEPRKDEPMSLFKDTGQHDPACCSMENSENLNSVRDEAEMSLAEQVNNPSLKYGNHRQSKHQTVKEELPGKETTVLDDPKVEFTDNQEESIIHSDDTDTRREIIPWRAEALITDSGPFNESPTKSMAKTDEPSEICTIIPENVIKISVQDVFGDLMKENGQSFLEELRRIYLDAEGQGYTLFDSGIALTSKTNQVEDNITYVTLRNGLQLGMTIPFSQLFLYYQLGLHIIITGQLNDDWYHAADRITQEHFLIKKVPVNCNWVKILHNFLSIPHHPSLLVPYAVMYDRNGFIHFLMEDRNVIAVGKPPKGFCFNKQKHMWETLNFLKFCKQNHLCPRDIEDAVLYTEKGICFDPSCLCSIEDLCVFKKSISRTLENLLCNESQEELSLETEALIERTHQCMEEDAELPSELWQTSFTSSNVAGPIPFSFPCFPNEK